MGSLEFTAGNNLGGVYEDGYLGSFQLSKGNVMTARPTYADPQARGELRDRPHPSHEAQLAREAPRWGQLGALRELVVDRATYDALVATIQSIQTMHGSLLEDAGERVSLQEQAKTIRGYVEALQGGAPLEDVQHLIDLGDAFSAQRILEAGFRRDKLNGRQPPRVSWRRLDREELLAAARDAIIALPHGQRGRPSNAAGDEADRNIAGLVLRAVLALDGVTPQRIAREWEAWVELFDCVLNATRPLPRGARSKLYEELLRIAAGSSAGLGTISKRPKIEMR